MVVTVGSFSKRTAKRTSQIGCFGAASVQGRLHIHKLQSNLNAQFFSAIGLSQHGSRFEKSKEGKSAINLSNLGNFCQIWPRAIYLC